MLRSLVIVGTLVGVSLANPSRTIIDVDKETGAARIAAHQAAMKSEAEVARLNDMVFPSEPSGGKWHHQTSAELYKQNKETAAMTFGFDPTEKKAKKDAPPAKPVRVSMIDNKPAPTTQAASVETADTTAKGGKDASASSHKLPVPPPKHPAKEEAAEEEKRHAKLSDEVWPHSEDKAAKWQHKGAAAELAHITKAVDSGVPQENMKGETKGYKVTAAQMEAAHTKEVESSFPKHWFASKHATAAKAAKAAKVSAAQKKHAKAALTAVWGKSTTMKMDVKSEHKPVKAAKAVRKHAVHKAMAKGH